MWISRRLLKGNFKGCIENHEAIGRKTAKREKPIQESGKSRRYKKFTDQIFQGI